MEEELQGNKNSLYYKPHQIIKFVITTSYIHSDDPDRLVYVVGGISHLCDPL